MGLFDWLRSLLGGSTDTGGETPGRRRESPATETEASVKGTDDSPEHDAAAAGTDATASTGSVTEDPPGQDEAAEPAEAAGAVTDHAGTDAEAAEPAEAAGPTETEPNVDEAAADDAEPAASGTDVAGSTGSVTDAAADGDEAAGPDDEPTPVPEDPDEGVELESISGIGPAYATRLNEAGIRSVADLLDADATTVAAETGISETRIGRWQDRAAE